MHNIFQIACPVDVVVMQDTEPECESLQLHSICVFPAKLTLPLNWKPVRLVSLLELHGLTGIGHMDIAL